MSALTDVGLWGYIFLLDFILEKNKMNISVFCGASLPHSEQITEAARQLGRAIARGGHTLLYGGSNLGLMGATSGAALQEGGRVVGVIPTFFSDDIIHSQPVSELVRVRTLAERKEYLIAHSDAFVALPGGIGTLDEVLEVMVANQLHHLGKPMILLNLGGYYNPFLAQLDAMRAEGLLRSSAGLVAAASVEECLNILNTPSNQSNPI
ncbi:MAG: TIGR00730 family Rossman fold protein [Bacteroidales bacterium]|nr:TIGR00730 family Rossman fold protein [Bacteroidales bacterium]